MRRIVSALSLPLAVTLFTACGSAVGNFTASDYDAMLEAFRARDLAFTGAVALARVEETMKQDSFSLDNEQKTFDDLRRRGEEVKGYVMGFCSQKENKRESQCEQGWDLYREGRGLENAQAAIADASNFRVAFVRKLQQSATK